MRWKLLVVTSIAATLVASALWFATIIVFFSPAAIVTLHAWMWPASLTIPLALSALAGFFVYRHTPRRRKTQGVITVLIVLTLTALACSVASRVLPKYLELPPLERSQVITVG